MGKRGEYMNEKQDIIFYRKKHTLLREELDTDESFFARGWVEYRLAKRHTVGLLVAPLRLQAQGSVDREVTFEDTQFPAGAPLRAVYEFNSYRVTYRYDVYQARHLKACIGLTAKIRDALVRLESNGQVAEKTNTGFVPLIHFYAVWHPKERLSLMVGGDALAAPQGRAEDVLCAVRYSINPKIGVKLGYRVLEGGADVAEVYNFTLLHYLVLGLDMRL